MRYLGCEGRGGDACTHLQTCCLRLSFITPAHTETQPQPDSQPKVEGPLFRVGQILVPRHHIPFFGHDGPCVPAWVPLQVWDGPLGVHLAEGGMGTC